MYFSTILSPFRLATLQDVDVIFEIVKAAYSVELGDSGLAFKNADRYISKKSVIEDLPFIWVLREFDTINSTRIVGCTKAVVNKNTQIVEIGPVAVRPDCQVWVIEYARYGLIN